MGCRLRIALTGGIGSGKSEVARRFAELGAPIIDTDIIARKLVEPGAPALEEIVALFGADILDPGGHLDRAALRKRIFADSGKREQLEAILHPRIRESAVAQADQLDARYCLLVIPLLLETGGDYPVDRVLVVDTPPELQYQRVAVRDGLSDHEIAAILATQVERQQRLAAADDVIVNEGSLGALQSQVNDLHLLYLALAGPGEKKDDPPS
ncbi:MAG: dephospho-CoA kinase [Thiogranum sp.]|nr:dephospho-CoA kinase [Thiogranum sp.]